MTFDQWWFHGHLDHPPNDGDVFQLPAGQAATTELGCNKGATSFFASSEGGDIRNGNDPCPGSDMSEWHTTGIDDLFGCSLAIAYKSDVTQVQPEDFTVFSVNQTCVWTRFTDFQVPAQMPPCPEGGCICAWFWIHSPDSGGEQNYMNGFRCNVTGSTSSVALAEPQVARRCGADPANGKMQAAPGNCTYGAKQPFYWFQQERNNMFEGTYAPPRYLDMYNFKDGSQDDIFQDSYPNGLPVPSPNSTVVPTPVLGGQAVVQTVSPTSLSTASLSSISPAASTASSSLASSTSIATTESSSSLIPSSSLPPTSVSVLFSTATVFSTAIVTVTQTAVPSSQPALSSPTSTVTVVNTVVVFVTETDAANVPSVTQVTSSSTIFVFATNAASTELPTSVPSPAALFVGNESSPPAFAQLENIDESGAAVDTTSSLPSAPTEQTTMW
ncbi:hypothetical protein PHLCEN_2v9991 [Hermanssonia centrifuga]|uniref:Lytic polysaccharide monooxygenase n=1 Tax=Hermanssonia centrifuga TaxID=98765 RepID=A0A2R6NP52_9APHY|nr:hypothetical protein PHLCEN_2v9991 [Hermanssonia centrifuga]